MIKKYLPRIALLTLICFIFCTPELALAAEGTESILNDKAKEFSLFATIFQTIGGIAFDIVTLVADPDFYLDINGTYENVLHRIWMLSRDTVNVVFAFMLVIGALATVITAKGDFFQRYAFKFVLAVILVNFSWFFPRVILDIGNVLAATVYRLPASIGTTCVKVGGNPCEYTSNFRFFDPDFAAQVDAAPGGIIGGDAYKCPNPNFCYKTSPLNSTTNTANGVLNGLIMNHAKFSELLRVENFMAAGGAPTDPLQLITHIITFITHTGFTIALLIAQTLVMIAMAVVFMIRIPVLWITISFMPFMFIGFVIGDLTGSFNTMTIFKKFVGAAFLPAVVAIPLTVGYIILNEAIVVPAPAIANTPSNFPGDIDNIYELLWMVTTILVIWKGFFMAVNAVDSDLYGGAVSGIKSLGDNLGNIAVKAPLSVPVLPGPKGSTGVSIGEASGFTRQFSGLADRGQLLDKKSLSGILGTNNSGGGTNNTNVNITNINNAISKINGADAANALRGDIEGLKKFVSEQPTIANESAAFKQKALEELAKNNGVVLSNAIKDKITQIN